jgi:hypothetical protein
VGKARLMGMGHIHYTRSAHTNTSWVLLWLVRGSVTHTKHSKLLSCSVHLAGASEALK